MPHFSSLKFSCIYRRWQLNKCLSVLSKSESYCVTGTHSFFSSLCFLSLVHTRSLCWTYACKQVNSFARWVQVCTEKNWINFKLILVFLLNSRGQHLTKSQAEFKKCWALPSKLTRIRFSHQWKVLIAYQMLLLLFALYFASKIQGVEALEANLFHEIIYTLKGQIQ